MKRGTRVRVTVEVVEPDDRADGERAAWPADFRDPTVYASRKWVSSSFLEAGVIDPEAIVAELAKVALGEAVDLAVHKGYTD